MEERDRIDEIVSRWAANSPAAPAVLWAGHTLSYGKLLERADRIAESLVAVGIGSTDVVAVQVPRSIDMVCAVLGVLRAGAIYTVLPIEWPVDRRREVLAQTGSRLCISRNEDAFAGRAPMVSLDGLLAGRVEPAPGDTGDDLGDLTGACCVFFTSGSTGQPKSAVVPHKGVIRVVFDPVLEFAPSTVMLQAHSPAWDTFALELWGPLLNGGVSVLRESEHFSFDDIRHAVSAGANTVFLTPTVFNAAVSDDVECLDSLDAIVLGGERVSPSHVKTFLDRCPRVKVFNIYGPVEATICVTVHRVTSADDFEADLPLGAPVASTDIYMLDESHANVGPGEVGEVAVAGDGLAYGYLGNPVETASRFRRLPLGANGESVRVYLTGDLGLIDEDGRLRFLGRRDRQVKVQGLRIEPSEVERVVGAIPGVASAVAVAVPVGAAQSDGIAVVYAAAADGPSAADVRDAVAAALPRPFVPKLVHRVDVLPLNPNGKVDLAATAELVVQAGIGVQDGRTRTPLMTLLAELEELTGTPTSADSDVMDLGLTSITALKLISRIRAAHGVRVPMKMIFRNRTPAAVADWIARQ